MSSKWKEEQHPTFINFISSFLRANSLRLNFVSIAPDLIFNCGGVSVAFVFLTSCDSNFSLVFERVQKLKGQFAHLYVVVTVPSEEQNDCFVRCLLKSKLELGKPPFVAAEDLQMGFEKIVKIALACGACKQLDVLSKLTVEREQAVQVMDVFVRVVSSIPGIDSHDAHALNQVIGSIEAIARASKEYIVENTDISSEKADSIVRFFRDPDFYMTSKFGERKQFQNKLL
uniref:Uncharacterized protein n=1 Tax=Kalanchoe fedtschenkoi TaxID=63787 RepID=A0A7N0ZZ31_KALFE